MTAAVSARRAARVPCPHCGYTAEPGASIAGHVAMAHRDAERAACIGANHVPGCEHFSTTSAAAPEPTPDGSAPRALEAVERATPGPAPAAGGHQLVEIPLDLVDVGDNVRVTLDAIDELAASIAEHGVLQPVKASLQPDGRYRLLWGQRRVLASRQAGLATIPAILADDADDRPIEQLVENLHRADLNPIDRAEAMRKVVDAGVSQADLARKLGIAPSTVSNDLRILTLDAKVVERIRAGEITPSHGKAIASLPAKQQGELVKAIVEEKLSAHALEGRLKWKADEAAMDRQRAERTEKWIPKVLKVLEAADVPKDVEISFQSAYNLNEGPLRAAIKKAGWKHLGDGWRRDREQGCDCTAIRIDLSGAKPTVKGVCVNDAHRPAAGDDRYAKARALREARNEVVAAALEAELRPAALSDVVLGVLWESLGGWGNQPADLVEGLARQAVWRMSEERLEATAAALGLELPEAAS